MYLSVAEIACHGQAVVNHGNGFGRAQRTARRLQLCLAVCSGSLAQLPEMVTTRLISSNAGFSAGSSITFSKLSTLRLTMSTSSSIVSGNGK